MSDWQIRSGAIVERPRTVREYPLLGEVYDRHDSLIDRHAGGGRMLEVGRLLAEHGFDVVEARPLGSPLLPLALLRSSRTARLVGLYERTQWVRWWTLAVGEPRADDRSPSGRTRSPDATGVPAGTGT